MAGMVDGRVAIVTGAGRGIGAGVAKMLAREGAKVVVNDFGGAVDGTGGDSGPAEEVVQEIKAAGGEAVANTADVSDFDQSEALVRQAIDTYGRLDVLVNVAGILRDRMIFNLSWEDWDAVIQVHMGGTFNTSRHAAAYWRELRNPDGHFRIINFTSGSGLHGAPGQPNYAAAKMGIVGLTYSCAHALQRYGVTSNAISPSAATRMGAHSPRRAPAGTRVGGRAGARATWPRRSSTSPASARTGATVRYSSQSATRSGSSTCPRSSRRSPTRNPGTSSWRRT